MARLITGSEQKKLDSAFVEKTGLPFAVLMEQAAASLVNVAETMLSLMEDASRDDVPGGNGGGHGVCGCGAGYHRYPSPSGAPCADADADVLVVAGTGNNGGDGWAAARQLLALGVDVLVFDAGSGGSLSGDAAANREAYNMLGGRVEHDPAVLAGRKIRLIIDALFGTGFRLDRPVSEPIGKVFAMMRSLADEGSSVLACDVPSGLDADTGHASELTVPVDVTVTFGRGKAGLITHPGCLLAGEVVVAPISMTDQFVDQVLGDAPRTDALEDASVRPFFPPRARDAHKGQFGRALLIGGSEGMAGALILAARACEKTGTGYTMLRAPEASLPVIAGAVPSALMSSVPEGTLVKHDLPEPDVIAVGPGAGTDPWVAKALSRLIPGRYPLIIDADGLNVLSRMPDAGGLFEKRRANGADPVILTPHPGEFRRLAPEFAALMSEDRIAAARALAAKWHVIVVLKGMATVIALPEGDVFLNTTGNAGLAKGGSGDVLTGMIAGFIAQRPEDEPMGMLTARAVFAHGRAAELAVGAVGGEAAVTPEDIVDALGETLCP